jgi:trk system potassium uptake protein TrkA
LASLARRRAAAPDSVAVIGLGRFGGQVADSLVGLGHEVLGIDADATLVERWADRLTHVAAADATDVQALRQLGVGELRSAVVGIGSAIEASLLSVLGLVDLGVTDIWAKAITVAHGKILAAVGAHHVVYPETAMGQRVAHLITGRLLDFIEFDDGYAIAKVAAPASIVGLTLAQSAVRTRFGVTVVGVKLPGQDFTYARPETVVPGGAILVVTGRTEHIRRAANAI